MLHAISFKVKLFTALHTKTGIVSYYAENSMHSKRFMGMGGSHLPLLVMTFHLKRDTPSHRVFNFSFNSLLLYQAHQ